MSAYAQNFGVDQFSSIKNPDSTQQLVSITTLKFAGMNNLFDNANKNKHGLQLTNSSLTSLNFSNSDKLEYGVHFNIENPQEYLDLNRKDFNRDSFTNPKIASSTLTTGAHLNYRITPNYVLTS
nr:hypothetical protein [uncultured Undibacterium sp.]